jgi:hypothetical protein
VQDEVDQLIDLLPPSEEDVMSLFDDMSSNLRRLLRIVRAVVVDVMVHDVACHPPLVANAVLSRVYRTQKCELLGAIRGVRCSAILAQAW